MKLSDLHKVHMVGIKGTGMSGLALVLAKLGIKVTGSDTPDSFMLLSESYFRKADIHVSSTFDENNLPSVADAVITSSQHANKNPEILKAKKLKIPVLTYADVISLLTKTFPTISVCGSHGKTTTINLLAHILQSSKKEVLAIAGPTSPQVVEQLPHNPPLIDKRGARGALVLESDEYENKLAKYSPFGVILTNVELDHPDYFKTKAQYEKVFIDFVKKVPKNGFLICEESCAKIAKNAVCKKISYGFSDKADVMIRSVSNSDIGTPFSLNQNNKVMGIFRTPLLGPHNLLNTAAAVLAAHEMGLNDEQIQSGIMSFRGSPRRMEIVSREPFIIDDYGHHPTEVRATLHALRLAYPDKKIITVFHPHTYSRTKKFLKEFGASFGDSDYTIVLEIFESRETGKKTISSKNIVDEIIKNKGKAAYAADFAEAVKLLKDKLNDKTLLLTIGAGDVWKLHKLL